MIVVAGVVDLHLTNTITNEMKDGLKNSLSRQNNITKLELSEGSNYYFAIGGFRDCEVTRHICESNESTTIMLGNPYLDKCISEQNEDSQLFEINAICKKEDWNVLAKNCRGVFAVIHYRKEGNELILISDKLGIRPLYYCICGDKLFFSSALRILESCSFVSKKFDIRGVSEIIAFGFPLAKRTAYKEISRIGASEILQFLKGKETSTRYWRWEKIPEETLADRHRELLVEKAYKIFINSVKIRKSDSLKEISFLSGGLDSRCIVATLKDSGSDVYAYNFSPKDSQDRFFAALFAENANIHYRELDFIKGANWSQMMTDALEEEESKNEYEDKKSFVIWSGDGGSVGTGFVYLNHDIINAAHLGEIEKAIALFVEYNKIYLPVRILKSPFREELSELVTSGIRDEVSRFEHVGYARALYLFLMENDQRRHLDNHFENLDQHNLLFKLPFFDSFFLEVISEIPVSYGLNHAFYTDWFRFFPSFAQNVPWQTYPGHAICSVPIKTTVELKYQWDKARTKSPIMIQTRRDNVKIFLSNYRSNNFPDILLNRRILLFASLLQYFKIKNCDHMVSAANTYIKYWR